MAGAAAASAAVQAEEVLADSAAEEILAVVVREAVGNSRGQRKQALPLIDTFVL